MQRKQQIARSSMYAISHGWIGLLLACAALISSTVQAAETAADDPMTVYYENTLTCAGGEKDNWLCYDWYYPGGYFREMQVIRRRDGFIALHNREGTFKATKTATGVTLCQTFNDSKHTWCRDLPARKVGDQWTETLASGQPQKFSILKGRGLLNFMIGDGTDTHIISPYVYADYPPDPKNRIDNVGAASR